jgi:predicted DNA-binding WGR domain protein
MITMRRTDPARNMARFYAIDVGRTLFGQTCVVRRWGRIGANGQSRHDWFETPEGAMAALKRLVRVKRRRGYIVQRGASLGLRAAR